MARRCHCPCVCSHILRLQGEACHTSAAARGPKAVGLAKTVATDAPPLSVKNRGEMDSLPAERGLKTNKRGLAAVLHGSSQAMPWLSNKTSSTITICDEPARYRPTAGLLVSRSEGEAICHRRSPLLVFDLLLQSPTTMPCLFHGEPWRMKKEE